MTSASDGVAGGLDPGSVTGWTLVRAHHVLARRFHATLAEVGLTPTQFGILLQLQQQPGDSQATLARSVLMTPQAMGEMLTSLDAHGLVVRTPGRPGTPTTVALTDVGRAALRRALPQVTRMNEPTALGLTPDEATTLNTLLHKVIHSDDGSTARVPRAIDESP